MAPVGSWLRPTNRSSFIAFGPVKNDLALDFWGNPFYFCCGLKPKYSTHGFCPKVVIDF